jgi:hypothetical protein
VDNLRNFSFSHLPVLACGKYPPLTFALQMNKEWPAGTVIYYGAENSDDGLVRDFNFATHWKLLRTESIGGFVKEIADIYSRGGAWFETTAIDQFTSNPERARWLETHTRKESWKGINDGPIRFRFVQVLQGER